jgi:peroxiredoxin
VPGEEDEMPVEKGQEAPDFTLKNPANEDVTLSSFRGRKNVVLVFYPLAFSGVCTRQLTQINQHGDRYSESDAQVLGVSVDSRYAQGAFARELGLTDAVLLADFEPKGAVSRAYGIYRDDRGYSGRATFVIDKQGIVQGVSLPDAPGEMPDEEEYFQTLAVCPV